MNFRELFSGTKKDIQTTFDIEATRIANIDETKATPAEIDTTIESMGAIEQIESSLQTWIDTELADQVIHDAADVDSMCVKIDIKMAELERQFLDIYTQSPGEKNPSDAWQAFQKTLNNIRAEARRTLLAELSSPEVPASTDTEQSEKNTQRKLKATIEELRRDRDEALEMILEAEDERDAAKTRVKSLEDALRNLRTTETANTPNNDQSEKEGDIVNYEDRRNTLLKSDSELAQKEEALDVAYTDILELLQTLQRKELELPNNIRIAKSKMKLGVEGATEELQSLEAAKDTLGDQIKEIERRLGLIHQAADNVKQKRRELTDHLKAISLVQEQLNITLPNIEEALSIANSVHDADADSNNPELQLPNLIDQPKSSEQLESVASLEGLPFTVEYTEQDLELARQTEQAIRELETLTEDELHERIPLFPPKEGVPSQNQILIEETYAEMTQDILDGTFTDKVKKAVVILGAMRKGNAFAGRVGGRVNGRLRKKELGMAKNFDEGAAIASRMFNKMDLLGRINSSYKLVTKEHVGSKRGKATFLETKAQIISQVWTAELVEQGAITPDQLSLLHSLVQKDEN